MRLLLIALVQVLAWDPASTTAAVDVRNRTCIGTAAGGGCDRVRFSVILLGSVSRAGRADVTCVAVINDQIECPAANRQATAICVSTFVPPPSVQWIRPLSSKTIADAKAAADAAEAQAAAAAAANATASAVWQVRQISQSSWVRLEVNTLTVRLLPR